MEVYIHTTDWLEVEVNVCIYAFNAVKDSFRRKTEFTLSASKNTKQETNELIKETRVLYSAADEFIPSS